MTEDERYMQAAIQLAALGRGQTSPNPLVGAVVVQQGEVVGQGAHLKAGGPHAEVHALRMAGHHAKGATVYVTLEPCSHIGRTPPCADALIAAGVARVVIAAQDPNPLVRGKGISKLQSAGIEVTSGVCAEQARVQNEAFFTWIRTGRPFVIWKCASTLDGYIAATTGHSSFVTGAEARASVQELRREVAAITVGIGTVLTDDPLLTVRTVPSSGMSGGQPTSGEKQPLRIVFDSKLRMPLEAKLLSQPGRTLIYAVEGDPASVEAANRLRDHHHDQVEAAFVTGAPDGRVDVAAALADLGQRGVNSLLLEGGAKLVSAFIRKQLIDKIIYFIAPKLLGGGIPALRGMGPETMHDALSLTNAVWSTIGADICLIGYPAYPSTAKE